MMKSSVTVDRFGRVVLPSEVRRRLNLRPGSRLLLTVFARRIELTPEPDAQAELTLSPSRRRVLPATGKSLDAVAATRVERVGQSFQHPARYAPWPEGFEQR